MVCGKFLLPTYATSRVTDFWSPLLLQGVRMQTVTSNLAMTHRKNTTNFILIANYIQGRLGIYAWMINEIPSWPLLASVTSNFTIHIFTWLFGQKGQELQNPKLLLLNDFMTFLKDFNTALLPQQILHHSDHFCLIYGTFQTFKENLKNWIVR